MSIALKATRILISLADRFQDAATNLRLNSLAKAVKAAQERITNRARAQQQDQALIVACNFEADQYD